MRRDWDKDAANPYDVRDAFTALLDGDGKLALLLFARFLKEPEVELLRRLLHSRGLA